MPELFGTTSSGESVERLTIHDQGLTASIITFGATLQDLRLEGFDYPLVLGFNSIEAYQQHRGCFGANVGRVANRLAHGKVRIGDRDYQLDLNEQGLHSLHGGFDNTGKRIWEIIEHDQKSATFAITLPDGHMGYPGNLDISLTYRITTDSGLGPGLEVEYEASSDSDTLCNLAHHSYFNLDGQPTVQNHRLQIDAEHYLPVDDDKIPSGDIWPVANTPFDFRSARALENPDMPVGYDHNFCLSDTKSEMRTIARLCGSDSRLTMTMATTETGLQIYNGAAIINDFPGITGKYYENYGGIAMEAQAWPDAPHHEHFPDISLRAGARYHQKTRYSFKST